MKDTEQHKKQREYMKKIYNTVEGKSKHLLRYYYNKYKDDEEYITMLNTFESYENKLKYSKRHHLTKQIEKI